MHFLSFKSGNDLGDLLGLISEDDNPRLVVVLLNCSLASVREARIFQKFILKDMRYRVFTLVRPFVLSCDQPDSDIPRSAVAAHRFC